MALIRVDVAKIQADRRLLCTLCGNAWDAKNIIFIAIGVAESTFCSIQREDLAQFDLENMSEGRKIDPNYKNLRQYYRCFF